MSDRRRKFGSARKKFTIGINVPLDLYALASSEARKQRTSVSAMLNPVLQNWLKEQATRIVA